MFDDIDLDLLSTYIDWTPFFLSWELRGRYPDILDDATVGAEATKLFAEAGALLDTIKSKKLLRAKAVFGLFPANAVGDDDVEIYTDESRSAVATTLCFLRQQGAKVAGVPNLSLADYIAPKHSGIPDWIGAFVVTAGLGVEELAKSYEADHDDYSSILVKALGDRLAEACAEYIHEVVRRVYWGYEGGEQPPRTDLIAEKYVGIRPAPGYPACPDHTEKLKLFELLGAREAVGVSLTESLAMWPASSVCGWFFSHPSSKYFTVGKINQEQLEDYARRKDMSTEEAGRWLAPILL